MSGSRCTLVYVEINIHADANPEEYREGATHRSTPRFPLSLDGEHDQANVSATAALPKQAPRSEGNAGLRLAKPQVNPLLRKLVGG